MARKYKTVGPAADALFKLRQERLALEHQAQELKRVESDMHEQIIGLLRKQKLEKASGKLATVSIGKRAFADVHDWESVYKYVAENDAWDILQRRTNNSAIADRVEEGESIDGLTLEFKTTLNVAKASAK